MNVVKLMGGLGNQFFQYSFGQMMKLNGIDVKYENSWFTGDKHPVNRPYILDKYNTNVEFSDFIRFGLLIKEKNYDVSLLKKNGFNFYGYWQYLDYYKKHLNMLRKHFTIKEQIENKFINNNMLSIHIRRGDYIGKHEVLGIEYYIKAKKIADEIGYSGVYIFCEDKEYANYHFPSYECLNYSDITEFEIMRNCRINIISNSTFSWWAAILNEHEDKIVIAPKRFVVRNEDKNNYNNIIHYPIDWIKI